MKLDPNNVYTMPFINGPVFGQDNPPRYEYPEIEVAALQYRTSSEAIRALLPECFMADEDNPLVWVAFYYNRGMEFMAGGEYRIGTVAVNARFEGEEEQTNGSYVLVMFEDKTDPIIGGREQVGMPKIYGDISAYKLLPDGTRRCEVSLYGHLLFGIDLRPMKKQNAIVRRAATGMLNKYPAFGYKYIGSISGPPDASYPTKLTTEYALETLEVGKSGTLFFGNASALDVGQVSVGIEALKTLGVLEVVQTLHASGSSVLLYNKSGRLR